MKVTLVGMPGGGKSSVARGLARATGLRSLDSDAVLEHELGSSIRTFFDQHGEEAFRDAEQRAIQRLMAEPGDAIVATGGGAVLRAANRRELQEHSTVIYLHSSPEELYRRLRHDTQRPLLQVADPLKKLRELYAQRDPLYRECAHFVIETGRPSVAQLVNMVCMQLELSGLMPGTAQG